MKALKNKKRIGRNFSRNAGGTGGGCPGVLPENELDVQQAYPFTVETMPVPTRIVKGETVEIRCELKREGRFSDARYTIRYFQPDGKGTLRMDDGMVLLPNDRYPLDREVFRLYYTSESEEPADDRHLFRGQQRTGTAFPAQL